MHCIALEGTLPLKVFAYLKRTQIEKDGVEIFSFRFTHEEERGPVFLSGPESEIDSVVDDLLGFGPQRLDQYYLVKKRV